MASNIYASTAGITTFADTSGVLNLGGQNGVQINGTTYAGSPFVEGVNQIGAVMTSCPKSDPQYSFTSSGPYTTYTAYSAGDNSNSSLQAWHMGTGDGYPNGTTQWMYSGDDTAFVHRRPVWASGNRLGQVARQVSYPNNQTSYTGLSIMLFPVRNTTGSPITRTFSWGYSAYWSAGYEGASVGLYTPNASTYSGTTGGTWTSLFSVQSSSQNTSTTFSVTVPANTTVILMSTSSWFYYTTYQFYEGNYWFNLSNYMDSSLICDQRMLSTMAYAKIAGNYSTMDTYLVYGACASLFGNR